MLAPIVFNSWLDNGDGSKTTLREAIEQANFDNLHDDITFDPGVFNTPRTIILTQGALNITESLTIKGEDASGNSLGITIDAAGNDPTSDSTWADGDLNGDGAIDDADLDLAFAQVGLWFDSVA
jgi:hypothetical protein